MANGFDAYTYLRWIEDWQALLILDHYGIEYSVAKVKKCGRLHGFSALKTLKFTKGRQRILFHRHRLIKYCEVVSGKTGFIAAADLYIVGKTSQTTYRIINSKCETLGIEIPILYGRRFIREEDLHELRKFYDIGYRGDDEFNGKERGS